MSKMDLKVLFIQRYESYQGEYAPVALCCVDEWVNESNPEWFQEECKKQLAEVGNEAIASKVIKIEVDQDKIRSLLLNDSKIKGEIKCL